ncbi:class I SAM-dependent methyltransferase [Desulfurivibrio sp. D14AmB]|uniref:class I SAM-dependent methyltransferase n=1 Tax=Desulfurivibrio sp. D14AmB TaxID=3374370 RepID=UPI00376EDD22
MTLDPCPPPPGLDCCHRPDDPASRCEVFINISQRFIGLLGNEASAATRNDTSREYPFVAMDSRQVFRQLTLARRHLKMDAYPPPALLDVGCGIGNVMLLAEQLGFDVHGIEKDRRPYEIACRLFDRQRVRDADIWNYEKYQDFEVIYYFRPFADRELQLRFEKMIEEKLQPGGILIANHKNSEAISADPRFRRLDPELPVWRKAAPA